MKLDGLRLPENWTSAAAAAEGILEYLGTPLPRHAVMGLTGHAWHTCLGSREGVVALPHGPVDLDWSAAAERYGRLGHRWERFAQPAAPDSAPKDAIDWAIANLDAGRPLIGWDFHLHEYAIIYGYDRAARTFHVLDVLSHDMGPGASWDRWPSTSGRVELLAPIEPADSDPFDVVVDSLRTAIDCFAGLDGPPDGSPDVQVRGTAALVAWADAMDAETEVDQSGNAYMLAVTQAARSDGAAYLADLAASLPDAAAPLSAAAAALRAEAAALAPLITLFPFPPMGHGNVGNAGLRRGAAMALRRAAAHERTVAAHIEEALKLLD